MTTRDEQTGLMNFGAFTFVVDHVVRRASRAGECATVLSIKIATDTRKGRTSSTPDSASIYTIARMLRSDLRGEDVVARLAEHEFGVALPDTDVDGGEMVVGWITAQLAAKGLGAADSHDPEVIVGRATFEPTNGPVEVSELLDAARASRTGPSRVLGHAGPDARDVVGGGQAVVDRRSAGSRSPARRHLRALRSREA
jgi:PleD family two-component response regulator